MLGHSGGGETDLRSTLLLAERDRLAADLAVANGDLRCLSKDIYLLEENLAATQAEIRRLAAENVMGDHCCRDYPVLEAELRLARAVVEAAKEVPICTDPYVDVGRFDTCGKCDNCKLGDIVAAYDAHVAKEKKP